MLKASQIRAARALLGWSVKTLADRAHLSAETLRHMENYESMRSPLGVSIEAVEAAIQAAGIEVLPPGVPFFGSGPGVRLRDPENDRGPSRALYSLQPEQIRAARALLRWTARDLAAQAGVSVGMISRIEGRATLPTTKGRSLAVQHALEEAGIEFIQAGVPLAPGGPGVRLRTGVSVFRDHGYGKSIAPEHAPFAAE